MTDYLNEARNAYQRAELDYPEIIQSAALIAIAEALQPHPKPKPEPPATINIEGDYDPASLRAGVQAVLDHDPRHQAQRELDELREVVKGADHTAAKYYKRMRDAEQRARRAESNLATAITEVEQNIREARIQALRDAAECWKPSIYERHGDVIVRRACPTCEGPSRETVGMVCQTCGRDYADADPT